MTPIRIGVLNFEPLEMRTHLSVSSLPSVADLIFHWWPVLFVHVYLIEFLLFKNQNNFGTYYFGGQIFIVFLCSFNVTTFYETTSRDKNLPSFEELIKVEQSFILLQNWTYKIFIIGWGLEAKLSWIYSFSSLVHFQKKDFTYFHLFFFFS